MIIEKMAAVNGTTVPENMNLSGDDDAKPQQGTSEKVAPLDEPQVVENGDVAEENKNEISENKEVDTRSTSLEPDETTKVEVSKLIAEYC